jgi:FlaA1/EpsC-like NDP-sugar epimerase
MKQGIKLCGVPVRGRLVEVAAVVRDCKVHLVVFAQPAASGAVIRSVWQQCVSIGIPLLVLPATASRAGQAMVTQLHKVQLDDLLRCEPTNIDLAGIAALLRGRRVLVTGAGGCVGRELCRQVLACAPSALIVLGRGENSVLDCVEDLRELRQPPRRSPRRSSRSSPTCAFGSASTASLLHLAPTSCFMPLFTNTHPTSQSIQAKP